MVYKKIKNFVWTHCPPVRFAERRGKEIFYDIVCPYALVSFMKCGHTWLRVMMGKVISLKYNIPKIKLDIAYMTLFRNIPNVAITHANSDVPFSTKLKIRKGLRNKKIILLVRDPRDVTVSLYHEVTKRHKNWRYSKSMSEFIREDFTLKKIIRFLNMWKKEMDRRKEDFLLVRYEDMHKDTHSELKRVFDFLKIPVNDKIIDEAVEFGSAKNMRKMEIQNKFDDTRLMSTNLKNGNAYKVRKAKVGSYKEELSKEDIEFVDNEIRSSLNKEFGYL